MFERFWNSLDEVSKAVNWTQLVLILFGAIVLSLTYVQYRLSTRKDFLSGNSQKQKEEILNQRVSKASRDAANSIIELGNAKKSLAETQEQFAKAAGDADSAVRQLSAAHQTIEQLQARSGKVETLALRIQIEFGTDPITQPTQTNTTYMDSAPVAAIATPDKKTLMFGGQQSQGIQVSENERVLTADLQILDQSSIAGRNISSLADYTILAIGVGPYLKRIGMDTRVHTIEKVKAFLRINGTEISIFDSSGEQSLEKLPQGELDLDVASSMHLIADSYNKLMTN